MHSTLSHIFPGKEDENREDQLQEFLKLVYFLFFLKQSPIYFKRDLWTNLSIPVLLEISFSWEFGCVVPIKSINSSRWNLDENMFSIKSFRIVFDKLIYLKYII